MTTSDDAPMEAAKWKSVDTDWYDKRWNELEAEGHNPHGEADFISRFSPESVLDAGCGTGRVAIELHARGCDVAGVDLDSPFIEKAKAKAPELDFRHGDLTTTDLGRTFDVVVMAGNVMIFVAPETEAAVVARMAAHVALGGRLVAGFQLDRGLTVADYDAAATAAGLVGEEHWSTWTADPASASDDYAVLVHQRPV
jgi:2-polyprenyl-3-methyl-5-hydroxy-6-metoxy-1,4-benzoquinol methylase